jgi:hypothetical protein
MSDRVLLLDGVCDSRFEAVREAFAANFRERGDWPKCRPPTLTATIASGYVTNDMGPRWQNPRNRALMEAVYACL